MYRHLVELSIELTNECTLSCLHCSSGSVPQRAPDELDAETHHRLIEEASRMGATVLSFSGGNPLLVPWLPELTTQASWLGFRRVLIYTTGHNRYSPAIWTSKMAHRLLDLPGITWIFSLHSHDDAVNDHIMNTPGALFQIKESIKWLKSQKAEVEVHMVPMKPNFKHIHDVRALCEELGVSKLSLLRFVPQTRGEQHKDELLMSRQDFADMQTAIDVEIEDAVSQVQFRAGCPIDFRHAVGLRSQKARPCHAGDDLMLVRPDGSVHPCAAWKSLPSDSNVRIMTLREIWDNSALFKSIREFKDAGHMSVNGTCSMCDMEALCKTGCLAQRLHAYGRDLTSLYQSRGDPLCPRIVQE